jgi:hypothetical protein
MPTYRFPPHWGGARPGAGRPAHPLPSRCISVHLPEELIEILDREANRRWISRSAIMAHYLREGIENAPSK